MCRPRGESEEPGPTAMSGLGGITSGPAGWSSCAESLLCSQFVKSSSNLKGASKVQTINNNLRSLIFFLKKNEVRK